MTRPVPRYPLPAAATLSDACEAAALQLLSDILLMHAAVTIPLGEMPQLISPQLLDSAAHRPFYLFGDDFMYQTGLDQAAALFQSLVQNHAFEDGNKRTALTACLFFLERCGYWRGVGLLTAKEAEELEALTLLIANEKTLWSGGTSSARCRLETLRKRLTTSSAPLGIVARGQPVCLEASYIVSVDCLWPRKDKRSKRFRLTCYGPRCSHSRAASVC